MKRIAFLFLLGTAIVFSGCKKDESPSGSGPQPLQVVPSDVTIVVGQSIHCAISGGQPPYTFVSFPDTALATASIAGSDLTITARAAGSTTAIIKDTGSDQPPVTIRITILQAGFHAIPSNASITIGQQVNVRLIGGTRPYQISTFPDPAIVELVLVDSTVMIQSKSVGSTFVNVQDASLPVVSLSIPISVSPIQESEPNDVSPQSIGSLGTVDLFVAGEASSASDVDLYSIQLTVATNMFISVSWQSAADLDLGIMNANRIMINAQNTSANPERCTLGGLPAGTYIVQITSHTQSSTAYSLTIGPR